MESLQSQTNVNVPLLEDPEDYHLYVAYSENEDKAVAERIIAALASLKNIKCFDPLVVYSSGSTISGIESGVDRCKAFLLIFTKAFMDDVWMTSLCKTMARKADERHRPNAIIVVRFGNSDDVIVPSLVTDVKNGHVLEVNESEFVENQADFAGKIYGFLSQKWNPKMDVLPVGNVATGLAWTFYYGYLQMLLPGLPGRIREYEKTWEPEERVMPRKAFLIVPMSCFCPTSLTLADNLFKDLPNNKIRYEATRAGCPNRNYDLPVSKLLSKEQDEPTYYVQAQFVTPILTMYEMYKGQIAGLRQQELNHQMHLFCYYLRSILSHSQTRPCHDKAIIICYDPEDKEHLLSSIVRDRIKLEIDKEMKNEAEAIPDPAYKKPKSDSAGLQNETFVETDPNRGRRLLTRYQMKGKPRGKALILSVRKNREGTKADEDILNQLWEDLDFEVDLKIDPTAKQMEEALASIQNVNVSQYSAFVCCILSHGYLGTLNGSNNAPAKIADLTFLLNKDFCPGLAGKPKMFFIQACQSVKASRKKQSHQSTQTDSPVESDTSLAGNKATLVPGDQDFLMSYATLPGFEAYRDTQSGTCYIKALDENIRKQRNEDDMDLESILKLVSTQVHSKIKSLVESEDACDVKEEQFPFHLTTMNKLIFL